MSILDSIRRFLFGASREELLSSFGSHDVYEANENASNEPVYEWPEVDDPGLLPSGQPSYAVSEYAPPSIVKESPDSGSYRAQLPDQDSDSGIRFQRPDRGADSGIRFQRGGGSQPPEPKISSTGPDDPLNPDVFHQCDVRAFCNRLRQGVNAVYGGNAVPFYRAAGITRSAYSRLISHPDYHPAKRTVLAMAAALHLNLPAAEDFLKLAGYALSPAYPEDHVWRQCFIRGIYDISSIRDYIRRYALTKASRKG